MANEESNTASDSGFRIVDGPVVPRRFADFRGSSEFGELPRVYGPPLLFAIPRDPRTIFAYWNVDWADIFAGGEPIDRQVYLRVKGGDGTDESEVIVEPMMGSYYAGVARPGGQYQVELGYYAMAGVWSSVASSEPVTMPVESASENAEIDLATVPFHLSFQRLIDLFHASRGSALSALLAQLQRRAAGASRGDGLTSEEWAIFHALDLSVSDLEAAHEAFETDSEALRKKAEAVLGFGGTSPGRGFGGSSPGSSPA